VFPTRGCAACAAPQAIPGDPFHTFRTLCASALLLASSAALASTCDTLALPHPAGAALDYQIVIGEARERGCSNSPLPHCRDLAASRKQYGVCVRSRAPGQPWPVDWDFLPAPGCDGKDDSHTLRLLTGPGNDQISAMLDRYIEVADPWAPSPSAWRRCSATLRSRLQPGRSIPTPLVASKCSKARCWKSISARARTISMAPSALTRVLQHARANPRADVALPALDDPGRQPGRSQQRRALRHGGDDVPVGDRDPVVGASGNQYETLIGNSGRNQCHGEAPPLFASVPSATGEAATDGSDLLHCWHQRQGLPGRRADRNRCSLDLSNPKRWIERPWRPVAPLPGVFPVGGPGADPGPPQRGCALRACDGSSRLLRPPLEALATRFAHTL